MIDNDNVKLLDKYVETCTNTMNQLHMGDFFFLIKRDTITAGIFFGITDMDVSQAIEVVCRGNSNYVEDLNFEELNNKAKIYLYYSYLELFSLKMMDNIPYQMQIAVDLLKRMISDDEIHITRNKVRRTSDIMVQKIQDDFVCQIDMKVRLLKDKMLDKSIYSDYYTVEDAQKMIKEVIEKRLIQNPKKEDDILYLSYQNRKPVTVETNGLVFREETLDEKTTFRPYFIRHSYFNKKKVSVYVLSCMPYSVFDAETSSREKMLCLKSVIQNLILDGNLDYYLMLNRPTKVKFPTDYFDGVFYLENLEEIVEEMREE